ncbi:ATPase [Bacteroidales bacterium]|nr:ATPase [Bacteroidales bacterium]
MNDAYFKRTVDSELHKWAESTRRKPLLLRGARQIGKSSAVRNLGKNFRYYVEVNFDDRQELSKLFEKSISPQEICEQLALFYRTPIIAGETLLFLDEIQMSRAALAKLRYFYEQYPDLHLIAAGSLLEFAIAEMPSFGVGRIRSLFMYPFSFEEFITALGDEMIVAAYRKASPEKPLSEIIHKQLIERLKIFLIIGGMPESVSEYVRTKDLLHSSQILSDIIVSLKSDFSKYKERVPALRIAEVFNSVVRQAEGKFIYERAAESMTNLAVKQALELLVMAGLVYPITHTAANGIPLGAEINPKYKKMILCDTGLFQHILNLDVSQILITDDFQVVNRGALAEIFAGTELLKASSCYDEAQLYCWHREKSQSNAQVDYIIQHNNCVLPIEIKAGTKGAMQSLRIFMEEKKLTKGVRSSLENFSRYDNIDVYPLYAISNLMVKKENLG